MSRNKPITTRYGNEGQAKGSDLQKQGNPGDGGAYGQPKGSAAKTKPQYGAEGQEAAGD